MDKNLCLIDGGGVGVWEKVVMNRSPVFSWIVIPFSEHQGQSRFGVTDNEFCFRHDSFEMSGRHPRSCSETAES